MRVKIISQQISVNDYLSKPENVKKMQAKS